MSLKLITKNLSKLLNPNNLIVFLALAAAAAGCGKEPSRTDYAARVNNTYLTHEELAEIADTNSGKNYKSEVIRNWINRELLYQQAVKEGIIDEPEFKALLENSKKELAAAILLKRLKEDDDPPVSESEIDEYYSDKINEFRLTDDHFYFNIIEFRDEEKAVQFRSIVFDSDWNRALNTYKGDRSIIREKTRQFLSEYEVYPRELLRMIKELHDGEISIVLGADQNRFIVVQLLNAFMSGTIPPLDIVRDRVRKKLAAAGREKLIRDYVQELYSENEIEVKN